MTPAADGPPAQPLPRGVLGGLALLHAVVFGGAAIALPWSLASAFTVLAGIVAAGFLAMVVCAAVFPARLPVAFRAASAIAISFLLWATWSLASAGVYLIGLYGGVGAGLAGAAGAAWCVVALFTLPIGAWGLTTTGGLGLRRRSRPAAAPAAVAVAVLIVASLLAWRASAARGRERVSGVDPRAVVASALDAAESSEPRRSRRGGKKRGDDSLFLDGAIPCEVAPSDSPFTLLAVARVPGGKATPLCAQGATLEAAAATLATALREVGDADQVVAAIDVLREIAPVPERGPLLGAVSVRPGLDGVCAGARCLPPWLAVARQQFTTMASFPSVQLDLGATATALRQALGAPAGDSMEGIDRFSSTELLLRGGKITTLERGRLPSAPPVDEETLTASSRAAIGFIVASQEKDGRFRYLVDPHAGTASFANFSIPRQAGTTLVVCEMAGLDERAIATARRSLKMLAGLERRDGERGGIVWPRGSTKWMPLGNTALSMIAFLACRDRVGSAHDALIHRMGRLLLAMQRESGSFAPAFDPATGVRGTGDPMYAEGQVVMALVLWEAMIAGGAAPDAEVGPAPGALREAIDRAMAHFAGPYWDFVVRDFFFFEENWHCLAARAALATHRRDDYERFCLDYVTMKARLVHDESTGGEARLVGAYGFGTVFPPHNTATAGFGEALAAAMAVARARGAQRPEDEARMREVLAYLMQQQWTEETCFACSDTIPIPGAFSEHFGEPTIRIDYVQHALAALGHGGHVLGLLPQVRAAGEATGP